MGQYYLLVNIDKQQCFPSLIMEDNTLINICGQKLIELVNNVGIKPYLILLLAHRWNGNRLVLVGDYANLNPYLTKEEQEKYESLFEYAHVHFKVIHPRTFQYDTDQHAHKSYIITNGKQYMDPVDMGDEPSYVQWLNNSRISTGLVILLGYSNQGNDLNVLSGDWAGDRIQIIEKHTVDVSTLENISKDVLKRIDQCIS